MSARRRLDAELVRRGLVASRQVAQELIENGDVLVSGTVATKSSRLVGPGEPVVVAAEPPRFVGRGGHKLDAALERFGIDVTGLVGLDAGSSTGGFTDCLLQRGAARVHSIDVGRNQLHERLRVDPRVVVRERTDIRSVRPDSLEDDIGIVVADLSFISVGRVAATLVELVVPGGPLVVLVKPQFEAGRAEVSRGRGVIRDPEIWERTLVAAGADIEGAGATIMGAMVSPLRGADGNVEFLVHAVRPPLDGVSPPPVDYAALVSEVVG